MLALNLQPNFMQKFRHIVENNMKFLTMLISDIKHGLQY